MRKKDASANPWIQYLKEKGGTGLTREKLRADYYKQMGKRVPARSPCAKQTPPCPVGCIPIKATAKRRAHCRGERITLKRGPRARPAAYEPVPTCNTAKTNKSCRKLVQYGCTWGLRKRQKEADCHMRERGTVLGVVGKELAM